MGHLPAVRTRDYLVAQLEVGTLLAEKKRLDASILKCEQTGACSIHLHNRRTNLQTELRERSKNLPPEKRKAVLNDHFWMEVQQL